MHQGHQDFFQLHLDICIIRLDSSKQINTDEVHKNLESLQHGGGEASGKGTR